MVFRRRSRGLRPRRRRAMRRRRFGSLAVRRPTFARKLTAGNGSYSVRIRRGGKAYPRLVGRGMGAHTYKFSDSSMSMWGSNADPQQLSQFANSIVEYAPNLTGAYVGHCASLFTIEGGGVRELHKRATDRIILKRLDLVISLNLGEAAQTGAGRLTLIWDRTPNLGLARPEFSTVFEPATNYPGVPSVNPQLSGYSRYITVDPNLKTDLNSFLVPDVRNRFEILYQQTVSLERGSPLHSTDRGAATFFPGVFWHYAGGAKSEAVIQKSLYLNRMVQYEENSTGALSGEWNEIVSGCIWVFWQSTNCRYQSSDVVPNTIVDTEIRLDLKCRSFFVDLQ